MNIAIGCNFYNCYAELKRLIDSIPKGFIQYFIGVDGIYRYHKEKYPDMPYLSNDGSEELLVNAVRVEDKFNLVLAPMANNLEFDKRNKYLEVCERKKDDIDVLIIVDSDEFFLFPENIPIEESIQKFKENLEHTILKKYEGKHNVFLMHTLVMNTDPHYDSLCPRIFFNPGNMRYLQGSHYYYANIVTEKNQIEEFKRQRHLYVQWAADPVKGVVLAHSHNLRDPKYMKQREEYIEYIKRFEGLVQSYYFDGDQSHKLAMLGIDRNQVNIKNKDDIIKKYLSNQ